MTTEQIVILSILIVLLITVVIMSPPIQRYIRSPSNSSKSSSSSKSSRSSKERNLEMSYGFYKFCMSPTLTFSSIGYSAYAIFGATHGLPVWAVLLLGLPFVLVFFILPLFAPVIVSLGMLIGILTAFSNITVHFWILLAVFISYVFRTWCTFWLAIKRPSLSLQYESMYRQGLDEEVKPSDSSFQANSPESVPTSPDKTNDVLLRLHNEVESILSELSANVAGFDTQPISDLFAQYIEDFRNSETDPSDLIALIAGNPTQYANIMAFNLLFEYLREGHYTRSDWFSTFSPEFDLPMKALVHQGNNMVELGYMTEDDVSTAYSNVFWD